MIQDLSQLHRTHLPLIHVIDLGTQPNEFKGEVKTPIRKVQLTFELVEEMYEENKPFHVSVEVSFIISPENSLNVSKCAGYPTITDVNSMLKILSTKKIQDAYKDVKKIIE